MGRHRQPDAEKSDTSQGVPMNDTKKTSPWQRPPVAPKGAPNVLVLLTDDVGYGACSTFGGPIATPVLDRLAEGGLRYNHFHTAGMCSPTRASLLTGRNAHRVSMGRVSNKPTCFDGYTTVIPESAGTLAKILRQGGYATAMFGKGHITPEWEMSHLGPFDRWPTGLGFDYFYGFLGFDTNMWAPNLVENTSFIEPPHSDPPRHFDELMADRAIDWIAQQRTCAPEKPFFAYYATGTAHAPHHAPKAWLEKYRGRFDQGWEQVRRETFDRQKALGVIPPDAQLTERPEGIPAWESLPQQQREIAARMMEAYAAALDHCDYQVGRIVAALKDMGEFENTLILFIQGDNGGSAEGGFNGLLFEQSWGNHHQEDPDYVHSRLDDLGGPTVYSLFPAGWGWALNAPFQYYKQFASHFGGTRNGLVVSWPERIRDVGGLRSQFHYISDLMPTVLEAAGVKAPEVLCGVPQDSLDGISMLYSVNDADAPSRRSTQVFECVENFGIYHEGWFANSKPATDPWVRWDDRKPTDPLQRGWELYAIRSDYSQSTDLAAQHPDKLSELQQIFWREAAANQILPIHPPTVGAEGRPSIATNRNQFTFRRRMQRVHAEAAPNTVGRSFMIEADIAIDGSCDTGVIACHGSNLNGYSFYLKDGHLCFHYNALAPCAWTVRSAQPVEDGSHAVKAVFTIDNPKPGQGGELTLWLDGKEVARGRLTRTLRSFINQDSFNIGCDTVSAISPDYTIPTSIFEGELPRVVITLS